MLLHSARTRILIGDLGGGGRKTSVSSGTVGLWIRHGPVFRINIPHEGRIEKRKATKYTPQDESSNITTVIAWYLPVVIMFPIVLTFLTDTMNYIVTLLGHDMRKETLESLAIIREFKGKRRREKAAEKNISVDWLGAWKTKRKESILTEGKHRGQLKVRKHDHQRHPAQN